jgi:hypothetical protein
MARFLLTLFVFLGCLGAQNEDIARQTYVYKRAGGCEIKLDVMRPPDDRPRPVIFGFTGGR